MRLVCIKFKVTLGKCEWFKVSGNETASELLLLTMHSENHKTTLYYT